MTDQKNDENEQIPVEILPFQVNYNGPAPIKSYFNVETKNAGEAVAHFRGRKLIGKEITLPENTIAIHAMIGEKTGTNEGILRVQNQYSKLRLWQHDHPPDTNSLQECFNWIEIANSIHTDE